MVSAHGVPQCMAGPICISIAFPPFYNNENMLNMDVARDIKSRYLIRVACVSQSMRLCLPPLRLLYLIRITSSG
jgi:hypothetical protein